MLFAVCCLLLCVVCRCVVSVVVCCLECVVCWLLLWVVGRALLFVALLYEDCLCNVMFDERCSLLVVCC